jgi:hypothetical protein
MNKRESRATIDELAAECNRLEAENEALCEQLSAMRHCLGQLVRLSSSFHASILDEFVKSKLLEEQYTRKEKGGSGV